MKEASDDQSRATGRKSMSEIGKQDLTLVEPGHDV